MTNVILYLAVARNKTVLCAYSRTPKETKYLDITRLILDKVSDAPAKRTLTYQAYSIHYIHKEDLTYLAIASDVAQRIPFSCLAEVEQRFSEQYTAAQLNTAGHFEFAAFSTTIHDSIDKYSAEDADVARQVERELEDAKSIMRSNIERVIDRQGNLESLLNKSSNLQTDSVVFKRQVVELRRQMWWQNIRTSVVITFLVLVVVYFLIGAGCGLPLWDRCV